MDWTCLETAEMVRRLLEGLVKILTIRKKPGRAWKTTDVFLKW